MKAILPCIILAFYLLIPTLGQPSDTGYVLMLKHGKVFYQAEGDKGWHSLQVGDTLQQTGTLSLSQRSYVLLYGPRGILEFNHSGVFKLAEYQGAVPKKDSLVHHWQSRAIDSLVSNHKRKEDFYKQALIDIQTYDDLLAMYPSDTRTYSRSMDIRWRPMYDNAYIIKIFHTENSVYYYRETQDDHITIDLFASHMPSDRCLYYTIQVKGSEYVSTPRCIYLMNTFEASLIELPAYQMQLHLDLAHSPLHNLMMAQYYEQHKIMFLAENHYKTALANSAYAERYKQLYYHFLERRKQIHIE
jgi:hypothetical protein